MKTIYYVIHETENKFHCYSCTDFGAFLCESTLDTYDEAKQYITEICKPFYHENFGSGYELIEQSYDSEIMNKIESDVLEILEFLNEEIQKPEFKFRMFIFQTKELLKTTYNKLFFPSLNK